MTAVKKSVAIWAIAGIVCGGFGDISLAEGFGSSTMNFLKIGVGARALGMGSAFTSIADNPSAVYWNAAGLRRLESPQAEFSHQSWYQDVNIENLYVAFPGNKISFGAGITYLSFGEIQSYDESGIQGEGLSMYDMAVSVSAAADLDERVSVGVAVKYIEQSFDVVKGSAFAGDIGLMADWRGIQAGVAAVNIGGKVTYLAEKEDLPASFRAGISFRQFDGKALFSLDTHSPFGGSLSMHQGVEVDILDQLSARSGLSYQTGAPKGADAVSFNLGLGLRYGKGRFDYTFIPSDSYGSDVVHTFSVSVCW